MMAVLLLVATAPAAQIRADIPPPPDSPDSKRVPATIELDWGVFADRVSRRHAVAAGETLRAIATKALGNAAHAKAIAAANPEVIPDPDKIRVGDVIWLPSVRSLEAAAKAPAPPAVPPAAPTPPPAPTPPAPEPAATELVPWYDGFWLENTGYRGRGPEVLKARATPGDPVNGVLVLVPHANAAALLTAITAGPVPVKFAEIKGALMVGMWADTLVHREDPTVRIVTTYKLTGAAGNSLTTDIARVRYDADGKVVTKEWVVPPPSYEFRNKREDASPAPTPPPAPPGSPTPSPTPAPAPTPNDPGMTAATATTTIRVGPPAPALDAAPTPAPDEGSRWPMTTGLLVALGGAVAVAGLWIYRRSRTPTPPPAA
jgi:nucleoid-associated protein YgaU